MPLISSSILRLVLCLTRKLEQGLKEEVRATGDGGHSRKEGHSHKDLGPWPATWRSGVSYPPMEAFQEEESGVMTAVSLE
ncbi:hypothetical protein MLD38_040734 [Melastoma candidum]|nr:hypothetical protein MLD38_040734 [Melastoma candidum]